MKQRITKLIARKGKFESSNKTCKKCTKEYNEKENFNWSCRTHQSDWGGEMWWCCGKREKEQPGCKFSKHESKEDDDFGNDETQAGDENGKVRKYVRCMCCKQLGHTIENCFRDPNFKTDADLGQDQERLAKIKDFRKLHADTTINTTHFIKKAVMVPLDLDEEGQPQSPDNQQHPFMRGIMNFDDYNYKSFNDYVLVEEPKTPYGKGKKKPTTVN